MAAFIEIGSALQRFGSPASGRCPPELAEICHRDFQCHVGKTNSREKARRLPNRRGPQYFRTQVGNVESPSNAYSDVPKDSAAKPPAWNGSARQSEPRKMDCIPVPIADRESAPTRRKGWRWQTSQSFADVPLANDRPQCASDRSARAKVQYPRSIP